MKKIIGVVGVKTSGKSTVSSIIQDYLSLHNIDVKETALADKLKNVCSRVFYLPRNTFDDQRYKEIPFSIFNKTVKIAPVHLEKIIYSFGYSCGDVWGEVDYLIGTELKTARHIAQIVGTQVLRSIGDEDIHCKFLELGEGTTVISDIRFENEFNYFNNLNDYEFIPLYVGRKEAEDKVDFKTSHESETEVFKFRDRCIKIDNNSTIDNLDKTVRNILRMYYEL